MSTSRRDFLRYASFTTLGIAGSALVPRLAGMGERKFAGQLIGGNSKVGHLMREGGFAEPASREDVDTVIVGGGIAGLSAAWWLTRHGRRDQVEL